MVEFVGLIKVNIIRGTNLVVRDMVTSDPYVVLSLGNQVNYLSYIIYQLHVKAYDVGSCVNVMQSMKTRVIKSNINPVWNECLMLSIPEHIPPLKLVSLFS